MQTPRQKYGHPDRNAASQTRCGKGGQAPTTMLGVSRRRPRATLTTVIAARPRGQLLDDANTYVIQIAEKIHFMEDEGETP